MSLTGLQIFKYLPGGKKEQEANCKKCGFPTCMAFAMKLAKKETTLDKCEFISDELRAILEEAYQIQQAEIKFGPAKNQVKVGNETVMFRHDKKFVNATCIAIKLESSDPDFDSKLEKIINYSTERVGELFKINAIALIDSDNNFLEQAKKISKLEIPLILVSSNIEKIKNILSEIKDSKPLVYLQNTDIVQISKISKEFDVPVIVSGDNMQVLADNSSKLLDNKVENLVLSLENQSASNLVENLTLVRRAAIENKFKPLGFPVISFVEKKDNAITEAIWASALVCKYSNIVVINDFDESIVYPLLTLRQNIFTDPQKPLQIEPKVYPIGDVHPDSPVIITTNFALTYFTVASEIEASSIPAYLVITPSDGMSVLTAWAASKFTGEIIAKAVKQYDLANLISHKNIIIPGYVNSLKDEIEEELPEWNVLIGPNDSVDIVDYLKNLKVSETYV